MDEDKADARQMSGSRNPLALNKSVHLRDSAKFVPLALLRARSPGNEHSEKIGLVHDPAGIAGVDEVAAVR